MGCRKEKLAVMLRCGSILLVFCLLPFLVQAKKTEKNYCQGPSTWIEWDQLIAEHPDDMGLQTLHALRIGLCAKVESKELSIDQGTTIFEDVRRFLIKQRTQEQTDKGTVPELRAGRHFAIWIKDRIEEDGFVEGKDFTCSSRANLDSPKLANQSPAVQAGDRRSIEYHLTLDMAKELAMVERNGKEKRCGYH